MNEKHINYFPDTVNPLTRARLGELFRHYKYNEIGKTPGIRIFQDKKKTPKETDCAAYALALEGKELVDKMREVLTYQQTENPKPGDFVLYFDGNHWTHIGILQENYIVRSKWNEGHVYEHPVFLAPTRFGENIKIVKRVE